MTTALSFGIAAGIIQVLGYVYYIRKINLDDISPNPTTWLIFAGDTTLLVVLEMFAGAHIAILLLPVFCALSAVYVALLISRRGRLGWPADFGDKLTLVISVLIAVLYTVVYFLWQFEAVPYDFFFDMSILFLILNNLNTFVAFYPMTKEVYQKPELEHAGPWTVWAIAYCLLIVSTYHEVGFDPAGLILYAYPVTSAALHLIIAYLARDARKHPLRFAEV